MFCFRHKRKVQNFLPCKNSPQNNCDVNTAASIYEDLHDVMPRPTPTHHHAQIAGRHIVAPQIEVSFIISYCNITLLLFLYNFQSKEYTCCLFPFLSYRYAICAGYLLLL